MNAFVCARMIERQFPSVQHLSRKISAAPASVNLVAQNRMTEVLQMHSDLVRAPAVQATLDQARFGSAAHHAEISASSASTLACYGHFRAVNTVARDRCIDRSGIAPRFPTDKREVDFLHAARGELSREL